MDELELLTKQIDELTATANDAVEAAKAGDKDIAEVKALINDTIVPEVDRLKQERTEKERDAQLTAIQEAYSTIAEQLNDLRKPTREFSLGNAGWSGEEEGKSLDIYEQEGKSFFYDVTLARKGVQPARDRLTNGWGGAEGKALPNDMRMSEEGKAMTEGTQAQGGYLVQPSVERRIVQARELDNVLRGLCSKINVNTNAVQFDSISLTTSAGWVAELAVKTESTSLALASVTASVFTAAGLATISNQLLQDANPAVDGLVTADLAKRLTALEETAFISGSGTNQPLGILNTPGIAASTLTPTTVSAAGGMLDVVLDAILNVQTNHGQPSAILMHPRTWTRIIKDRNTAGVYTIDAQPMQTNADFATPRPGGGTLFGVRVVLSNRVPTNLGAGTNESRIIVADFGEALILDRQGITVDESPHVYFTSNQTVFRCEMRVGFTAARTPAAFNVIGGAGLANG
jgi:HK97 family phage major capsid protein